MHRTSLTRASAAAARSATTSVARTLLRHRPASAAAAALSTTATWQHMKAAKPVAARLTPQPTFTTTLVPQRSSSLSALSSRRSMPTTTTAVQHARHFASQIHDATFTERPSTTYGASTAAPAKPETAGQRIARDRGLSRYVSDVYMSTAIGIATWMGSLALFATQPQLIVAHPIASALGGLALSLVGTFSLFRIAPRYVQRQDGSLTSINPTNRKLAAAAVYTGFGLMSAPLVTLLLHSNPAAIPIAAGSALAVMAGSYLFARSRPDGSLTTMGPALSGGLLALIGVGFLNMFIQSPLLHNAFLFASIPLFAALTAYDTHVAIQDYKDGRPDHLLSSQAFFMNFVNLFQSIAQMVGMNNVATMGDASSTAAGGAAGMGGLGDVAGAGAGGLAGSGFGGDAAEGFSTESFSDSLSSEGGGFFDSIGDTLSSIWGIVRQFLGMGDD